MVSVHGGILTEPYIFEPHNFNKMICNWPYCSKCGLVLLKNAFTQWCVKKGCNNEDHPGYKAQWRRSGNPS